MVFDKKAYHKSPACIRSKIKSQWKLRGIIHTQGLDYLYDNIYLPATHCKKCNIEFGSDGIRSKKTCDHNHFMLDSHNFRVVICHACNINDRVTNTSGVPNVHKHINGWCYNKRIKGVAHFKYFKTKQEAINYKESYENI